MANPEFINRQLEMGMVAEGIEKAHRHSVSCITHFYGIRGIGKTKLLEHMAERFCPPEHQAFCLLLYCNQIADIPNWKDKLTAIVSTQLAQRLSVQVPTADWSAFVSVINQQKGHLVPVLLFDAVDCLHEDVFHQLEQMMWDILQDGRTVIVTTGYRERPAWEHFGIRKILRKEKIGGLKLENLQHSAMVYPPVYAQWAILGDKAIPQAEAKLLEGCSDETRTIVRYMAVLRKLDRDLIQHFATKGFGALKDLPESRLNSHLEQMRRFDLVDPVPYEKRRYTYVLDPTARVVLEQCLGDLHKTAFEYYKSKIEQYPEQSDIIIPQVLYHLVKSEGPSKAVDEATIFLKGLLPKLRLIDVKALYEEIQHYNQDVEVLYGQEYRSIILFVEGHLEGRAY